jgi:hypothetical protein
MESDAPRAGPDPEVPRPPDLPPPSKGAGSSLARAVAIVCALLAALAAGGLAAIHIRFAPSVAAFEAGWIDEAVRAAGAGPEIRGRVAEVLAAHRRAMLDTPLTRGQVRAAARAFEDSPAAIALTLLAAEAALNRPLPGLSDVQAERLRRDLVDLAWGAVEGRIVSGDLRALLGADEGDRAGRRVGRLRLPLEAVKDLDRLFEEEDLVARRGLGGKGREALLEDLPGWIRRDLAASLEAGKGLGRESS